MAYEKLSMEQFAALLDAGKNLEDISRETGVNRRTLQRKKACLLRSFQPVAPACPPGFVVNKMTTTVDADGKVRSQSMRVGPEPEEGAAEDLIPEGMFLKGLSTLTNGNGDITAQWTIARRDLDQQKQAIEAAIRALAEGLPILPRIVLTDHQAASELLNLYTLTDCHVGMLAWKRETGEPWDLDIAEKILVETFAQMIAAAPPAEVGVVNQLGDFLHFDGLQAITPTSGHQLDADSRFQKMVEVAVRILEKIIILAAQKHPLVRVMMHEGNHDIASSVWLRVLFARVFRDNPRVIVDESPNPYVAFQHGKTMLGFHHGHLAKKDKLPLLFATQFAPIWGKTEYRYIHTGHYHHIDEKEHPGVRVEQHATLSAKDAYAARGGWHSLRQATSRTYHSRYGEVIRATFPPVGLEG